VAAVGAAAAVAGLVRRPSGHPITDAVVLAFGIPLVVRAWLQHRDGSPRGTLLLTGSLGYLMYVYANYALGVAYNPMYLAYVTLLSASLFGFVAGFTETSRAALAAVSADPEVPHRFLSWFLLASAAVTAVAWLQPLVTALLQGTAPPLLDVYTTPVTFSLDLAVIAPAAAVAGLLVRRRQPVGYLLAAPLLVTIVMLLPTISVATALQVAAGISFTPAEVIGPIAGFGVLGVVGTRLLLRLLRAVPTTVPSRIEEADDVHVRA
jgi:hypothetical protein